MKKKAGLTVMLIFGFVLFLLGIVLAIGGASVGVGVVALFVGFVLLIISAALHGQQKRRRKLDDVGAEMRAQIMEGMQRARQEEKKIRAERDRE